MSDIFVKGRDFAGLWHIGELIGEEAGAVQILEEVNGCFISVYVTKESLEVIGGCE